MTAYDLSSAVTSLLDTTSVTDLDELAAKVAENVPAKMLRAVLAQALRDYIRVRINVRRMNNPILTSSAPARPEVVSSRSSKVAAIRNDHARALRDLIHVGKGIRKQLGDCGYDDLMFAAHERWELSRRTRESGDRCAELANQLRAYGVDTVCELPPLTLDGWMEPAA